MMGDRGDVGRDQLYRYLNGSKDAFRANFFNALPQFAQDLAVGYAAGMNRYLRETGVDNLPDGEAGCRGAAWVYEVDEIDLFQYLRLIGLAGSSDQSIIRDGILRVHGAGGGCPGRPRPTGCRALPRARAGGCRPHHQAR